MSDWLRTATEPDWDSYGGKPTTEAAIKTARNLVGIPLRTGGIQIEMSAGGADIEIEIDPDGKVSSVLWMKAQEP